MEHVDKSAMFNISGHYNDAQIHLDCPDSAQSIGAAIAFVVVIIGWAINKIFGRELLW